MGSQRTARESRVEVSTLGLIDECEKNPTDSAPNVSAISSIRLSFRKGGATTSVTFCFILSKISVYNQLGIELNKPEEKTTGGPDPYNETLPPDFNEKLGEKKVSAATTRVFIMSPRNLLSLNVNVLPRSISPNRMRLREAWRGQLNPTDRRRRE